MKIPVLGAMLHVSSICYCQRHRTTLRFDFLHSLMVCSRHWCSDFRYTESRNFRIQLCLRINTKPNGKEKWFEDREEWHWLVTSLPLFLKSIAVPIDHKRVNIIETLLFWTFLMAILISTNTKDAQLMLTKLCFDDYAS